MATRYVTLCPHISIWRARQEMMTSYLRYRELTELLMQAEKEYRTKRRIFEELEITRVLKEEPKKVKQPNSSTKEVKLTMEQVRKIAEKLGVSIDFD